MAAPATDGFAPPAYLPPKTDGAQLRALLTPRAMRLANRERAQAEQYLDRHQALFREVFSET